jgi:hypothetical protein
MKLRTFLGMSLVLVGSMTAVAQSKHPMFDPLFALSYDPQLVHFELAPASITQLCSDLRGRKLWVYAEWTSGETKYFIVSGFIVNHPDGPGKGDISPDETGVAVALQGSKCTTDGADWTMSGEIAVNGKAKLPDAFPEALPGHRAPAICDKYGTCHYAVRSRQAEAVLEGLASDALERFSKAYGGKQGFLSVLQKSRAHPDLPPVLRGRLDEYRKQQ